MSEPSGHWRPAPAAGIVHQKGADSVVLLNLGDGEYFALDDVGARIWELCDGTRTADDLIAILCEEYDAPAATVREDALALLDELVAASLLVAREPAPG